jgi:hypothetical protein
MAYTVIGQNNSLFAFAGFTGPVVEPSPDARGYVKIAAAAVASGEEGRGLWAVNGIDRRVYRWREVDQYEVPTIHNVQQKNGLSGEPMLGGALRGVQIDTSSATLTAFDGLKNLVFSWFAPATITSQITNPF